MAGLSADGSDFAQRVSPQASNIELFNFEKTPATSGSRLRSPDAYTTRVLDRFLTVTPLEAKPTGEPKPASVTNQLVTKLPDSFTIVRGADGKLQDVTGLDAKYRDYVKMSDGSGGTLERVNGGRREEKFFLLTNRDGSKEVSDYGPDGSKRISRFVDKPEYLAERQSILKKADLFKFAPEEKAKLIADVARFEQRAEQRGFTPEQVKETYEAIGRFFTDDQSAKLPLDTRVQLAQQVMSLVATPTAVDQGRHNSCTVASLESVTYARDPALAANLVADIALTGQHKLTNGVDVKLNHSSLTPDSEAVNHPPKDGERGFASQLFQVTAVNAYYQSRDGLIRWEYSQTKVEGEQAKIDTGERLRPFGIIPTHYQSPSLSDPAVAKMIELVTGKAEPELFLAMWVKNDRINSFRTLEEFQQKLEALHAKKNFPAFLMVDTSEPPFNNPGGGPHALSVVSYDPKTRMVQVDNQWGLHRDMIEKPVSIDELYKSTRIPLLAKD